MSRLIAIKGSSNFNPDLGLVIPVAIENDDGGYSGINLKDYPNEGVFVSKDYRKIDENFKEEELFLLRDIQPTDNEWQENKRLQKYYAIGDWAERIEHNLLIPVIPMEMPDISTGQSNPGRDLPKNTMFFIQSDGKVNGPFLATKDEEQWLLTPYTATTPLNLPNEHIASFDVGDLEKHGEIVTFTIHGESRKFITSLRKIERLDFEKIDYISDARLIKFYGKSGFGKGFQTLGKQEAIKLSQCIDAYKKKAKTLDNSARLKRLEFSLSKFLDASDYGKNIVESFLVDNIQGRRYLDSFFADNKELLIKEKIAEIEEQTKTKKESIQKEINDINRVIDARRKDLEDIEKNVAFERIRASEEVKRIQAQTEEQAHQSLLQKQEILTNQNADLEEKIKRLAAQCQDLTSKHEDLSRIINLKEEIQFLSRTAQEKNKESMEIERTLQSQRNFIASPQIGDRLTELKTLIQMLNGKPNYGIEEKPTATIKSSTIELSKSNRSEYIQSLIEKIHSDEGRPYTFDEMANLTICISQSFLTILSGPPGTGKTSTALRLASTMSLNSANEHEIANFLSISVGRGWVSGRDILGFYNSLKDVYQPSRTGLYQFLRNQSKNADQFTKLVLLDEANLSSVEHYWSDFLGMCDADGLNRKIDLGIPDTSKRYINIGDNLRFIATINNDSTTEKLSPRLIDRAPIISLSESTSLTDIPPLSSISFNGAIPHSQLAQAFDVQASEAELRHDEKSSLDQILSILSSQINKSSAVHVSRRKINAITRYCYIANELPEMRIQPLDYAISQHILPLIQGHGQAFKERLLKLDQKLTELDLNLSKKSLRSILDEGDNYAETYSYF